MRGSRKCMIGFIFVFGLLFVLERVRESISVYSEQEEQTQQSKDTFVHRRQNQHTNIEIIAADESYNINDNRSVAQRFQIRKSVLQKTCLKLQSWKQQYPCEREEVKNNLKNATGSHVVYCAIEKTGSTFWKRILQVLDSGNNYTSPLDIETMQAEYQRGSFQSMSSSNWDAILDLTRKYTSIMFVRNPYTRLFSAWLDKFYSTNLIYWISIGLDIVKSERNLSSSSCAHDVTFSEFANYVSKAVLSNHCNDRHFSPSFKHCDPCTLDFDYIGKYETMNEDTLFILNALNVTKHVSLPNDAAEKDAIKDGASWVYYQKDEVSNCGISFSCALFRVWQRLQSRGVIATDIPFPFKTKQEADTLTRREFELALRIAHAQSKPKYIRNNRKEALAQALRSLPVDVEKKLQDAFMLDFQMFGYEKDTYVYTEGSKKEYTYFQDCPAELV